MFFKTFVQDLNHFAKHNMKHIDKINLEIYNPKTVHENKIIRKHIYNMSVYFEKDNLMVTKHLSSNDLDDCVKQLKETIDKEIKI